MADRRRVDPELERGLLAALILDGRNAFADIGPRFGDSTTLSVEHFNGPRREIFRIVWDLWRKGSPINWLAIRSDLIENGDELAGDELAAVIHQPFQSQGIRALVKRLEVLRERRDSRGKPKGEASA